MTKKHEMSEEEFFMYQKIHQYEDPVAEEESKILKEKNAYHQLSQKGKTRLKQKLNNLGCTSSEDIWDELEEWEMEEARTTKELRNARTHKKRLRGLRKQMDLSENKAK